MNHVWLLLNLLNVLGDCVCFGIHIVGSQYYEEPQPHNHVYCGIFMGYLIIGLLRGIRYGIGERTLLQPKMIVDGSGCLFHFICAFLSLYYAENDFHLMFMGPQQELDHQFFVFCKQQSVACLVTSAVFLLQFMLELDLILKTIPNADLERMKVVTEPPIWDEFFPELSLEQADQLAKTQGNVYFLGRHVDYWLRRKSHWFRQLAGGQELPSRFDQRTQPDVHSDSNSEDVPSVHSSDSLPSLAESSISTFALSDADSIRR